MWATYVVLIFLVTVLGVAVLNLCRKNGGFNMFLASRGKKIIKHGGDCGCGCGRNVVFISGVSGVGKTTVGKKVLEKLKKSGVEATLIDQDSFYKSKKTGVTLSNGTVTSNYDTIEAVDWDKFNDELSKQRKLNKCTIVTGFALWRELIKETPDRHFLLTYYPVDPVNGDECEYTIEEIIKARQTSKKLKGSRLRRDELMVREVVWPFYKITLNNLGRHTKMSAYETKCRRRDPDEMAEEICREINKIKPGIPPTKGM